ncbi:dihydroxyacetone kinase subunit DhaK [Dactylosporangium sucinum]|uniref:Dihydroxyacetone kinase n=1 Tax=Dactylosporangium sucinum TaxID=1424081 RepID=A0A917TSR2_9ACTN|nr:dihydroxyacetone kinase subunit DhaK [Dactylosporangium sucinum]GGM35707.1 dihydroxyacetone kinase [Dactylosporangium sucinum]
MSIRSLADDGATLVASGLTSLQRAHPDLVAISEEPAYVIRAGATPAKVALVSGGGSGHEPLHTGFVGMGMLDAAVPGAVFASPTAFDISTAIRAAHRDRGALLIVKNYTGDVLNFSIAAELAAEDGIATETVLVDDDVATDLQRVDGAGPSQPDSHRPGRRGTAAVIAVEKICGAAAEAGAGLAEVAALGRDVVHSSGTMALAFRACTHPGDDRPAFDLGDDEIEFGVGIHGERGVEVRPRAQAGELIAALTAPVQEGLGLGRGDAVIAIVNGLGAMTGLELSLAHHELDGYLGARGVTIARTLVGNYVTSLDMRGLSITLVRATDRFVELWDAPVRTPALTW